MLSISWLISLFSTFHFFLQCVPRLNFSPVRRRFSTFQYFLLSSALFPLHRFYAFSPKLISARLCILQSVYTFVSLVIFHLFNISFQVYRIPNLGIKPTFSEKYFPVKAFKGWMIGDIFLVFLWFFNLSSFQPFLPSITFPINWLLPTFSESIPL